MYHSSSNCSSLITCKNQADLGTQSFLGPREPFTGTGIVRETSTRYVRFIKVVSSFLLTVNTLILLELVTGALDSDSGVGPLDCFWSSLTEEIFVFPFKFVDDLEFCVETELGLEEGLE